MIRQLLQKRTVAVAAAATLLIGGAVGLVAWFKWTKRASVHHWTGEYLPQPDEGAVSYLLRGINLDLNHFTPLSLANDSLLGPLLLLLLAVVGALRLLSTKGDGTACLPIIIVLGTLGLLFVAGLAGQVVWFLTTRSRWRTLNSELLNP